MTYQQKRDELLEDMNDWCDDCEHPVCTGNKKTAKNKIDSLVKSVIGENEKDTRGNSQNPDNPKYHTRKVRTRNQLRAEQLKRMEK